MSGSFTFPPEYCQYIKKVTPNQDGTATLTCLIKGKQVMVTDIFDWATKDDFQVRAIDKLIKLI